MYHEKPDVVVLYLESELAYIQEAIERACDHLESCIDHYYLRQLVDNQYIALQCMFPLKTRVNMQFDAHNNLCQAILKQDAISIKNQTSILLSKINYMDKLKYDLHNIKSILK